MSLHVEVEPFDATDRAWLRRTWLKVQDYHCAACGGAASMKITVGGHWVLDFDRNHDEPPCVKGLECFDCVLGVVCRECMFQLVHLKRWRGYMPRQPVNGLSPMQWHTRASAHLDLGVSLADHHSIEGWEAWGEG